MDCGWSSSDTDDTETEDEDRTQMRQESDFDCVMLTPVQCHGNIPWLVKEEPEVDKDEPVWEDGLAPKPLYSFYYTKTRIRHWSHDTIGVKFLCSTIPGEFHKRGGDPRFTLQGGVCRTCIDYVQIYKGVEGKEYFDSQQFSPPARRGKGRSQLLPVP